MGMVKEKESKIEEEMRRACSECEHL